MRLVGRRLLRGRLLRRRLRLLRVLLRGGLALHLLLLADGASRRERPALDHRLLLFLLRRRGRRGLRRGAAGVADVADGGRLELVDLDSSQPSSNCDCGIFTTSS